MKKSARTIYYEIVKHNLCGISRQGGGDFSLKELAQMCDLEPTRHFRRRVEQVILEFKIGVIRYNRHAKHTNRIIFTLFDTITEINVTEKDFPF
jgi:hypothetical protein